MPASGGVSPLEGSPLRKEKVGTDDEKLKAFARR
jgi:hypothetical protein